MSEHDDRERPRPELEPDADDAELREAERLREALEGGGEHDLAELARSLRAAWEPGDLSGVEHERLVRAAMSRARGGARGRVIYVAFGATALAAAAAFALTIGRGVLGPGSDAGAELTRSRSTQELFGEPFPRQGGTSARMDRITDARGRDYRANLFARMGVR